MTAARWAGSTAPIGADAGEVLLLHTDSVSGCRNGSLQAPTSAKCRFRGRQNADSPYGSPAALPHLLETFVVGEIVRQTSSWMDGIAGAGHWRTRDGDEVDLVLERDDGAILAFEVKAAARSGGGDFRPLRKLADAVGAAFVAGIVLYTGSHSYNLEDDLFVMPIDRLWLG